MTNPRNPTPVDAHIGRYLKKIRTNSAMTQSDLADALGVTFQQIQKYERGTNRISASRLWEICQIFETEPNDFFRIEAQSRESVSA